MPELPEVETIRRRLAPLVAGRVLRSLEILDPRWCAPLHPHALRDALEGRVVRRLTRRGKYLVWEAADEVYLLVHLRMTGTLLYDAAPGTPYVRVRFGLADPAAGIDLAAGIDPAAGVDLAAGVDPRAGVDPAAGVDPRAGVDPAAGVDPRAGVDLAAGTVPRARVDPAIAGEPPGSHVLSFCDPRRFGTGELVLGEPALQAFFAARLGVEPLGPDFTTEHLFLQTRNRRAPIKAVLLDQRRVAGVGNIYANEALFRARIHPLREARQLKRAQVAALRDAVVASLEAGIDAGGATIDDFRHPDGVKGAFQDEFLVHSRDGEPCVVCGGEVVKFVAAGRGTYACETCQTRPRRRLARPAHRRS
jgi:formamidopyrimidine-DNA glycosylase